MEDIMNMIKDINLEYVLGIIGLILTGCGIFYIIRPKLRYTIEVLPFVNPSKVDKTIKNKLKIIYDNQEVNDLSIAKVTILSKGTDACDFSAPIKIQFNSKILYAYPNKDLLTLGIAKEYVTSSKSIEFLPNYINTQDKIIFYVVLETPKKLEVKVTGRCKGCSDIEEIKSKKYLINIACFALGALLPLSMIMFANYHASKSEEKIEQLENFVRSKKQELYTRYSNDRKEFENRHNNISTVEDLLVAYELCFNKLNFYIDTAQNLLGKRTAYKPPRNQSISLVDENGKDIIDIKKSIQPPK